MANLRFDPDTSSVLADDSKLSATNDSTSGKSLFVSPMAKKRKNILSGITVKRDCSVKFDLDSTIESEGDTTMESSAIKILREVNRNRRLISINMDDTVASLEKTEVSEVVPANMMREKGITRQISLDLEFSQSSTESLNNTSRNHNSIENLTHAEDEYINQNSSLPKEAPDFIQKEVEEENLNNLKEKGNNQNSADDNENLTHSKVECSTQENSSFPKNMEAPDFRDVRLGDSNKVNEVKSIESSQSMQTSMVDQLNISPDSRDGQNDLSNIKDRTYNKDAQHSHVTSLINQSAASNISQRMDGTYAVQNKSTDDKTGKLRNETFTINDNNIHSNTDENSENIVTNSDEESALKIGETKQEVMHKETKSTPLRRSLRNQKSDYGIDNEKCIPQKTDNLHDIDSRDVENISSNKNTSKAMGEESQSSKKKSLSDKVIKKNDTIPRKKPSFNFESLDYDEDMEDLQINHTCNVSSNVDSKRGPTTPRSAQHSINHLKNKRPLQPLVLNVSLPKIEITEAQEKRKTVLNDSKSFENTVKEFTPEVCSTYIDIDCSDNLRSCIGNDSQRFSKVDFGRPPNFSESAQNQLETKLTINEIMPLSPEIRDGSPIMDLELSTHSDDVDFDNDERNVSKHEQDSANAFPTKPVEEKLKSIKDSKNDNREPDASKHEQDSANAFPTKPVDEKLKSNKGSKNDNREPDASKHEQDSANAFPTKPVEEKLKSIKDSKNDNREPDASKHEQDSANAFPTKPVDEKLKSIKDSKHDNREPDASKHEQDSANAFPTNPVDEKLKSIKDSKNDNYPAVELESVANSSKILPQAVIMDEGKVSQESSSTKKRKSADKTKDFSIPSVTLKKRKTVKTADSRDETIILNKSSLLRRTRSSSSMIKENVSKGTKAITDLSLDSSLDVSSIRQVNRKKLIYHSTPVHRTSKKAKMDEASEGETSLDISKLSEIPSVENNYSNQAVIRESSNNEESSIRATRASTSRSLKENSVRLVSKVSSVKESIHKSRSNNSSRRDVSVGGNSEVDLAETSRAKSHRSAREGNSLRGRFVESTQNITNCSTTFDTSDDSYDSDSSVVESTGPDTIAIWCEKLKKKPIKTTKPKPPKLFMPPKCKWVNKALYQYLEKKLKPKFSIEATKYAEAFVMDLYDLYNRVLHKHPIELTALKKKAYEQGICQIEVEFCLFLHRFMPFHFKIQVLPTGGAFNLEVPSSSASPFDEL